MEELVILNQEDSEVLMDNNTDDECEIRIPISHLNFINHSEIKEITRNISYFLSAKRANGFSTGKRIDTDRNEIVFYAEFEY